jgi:hypothetical protein
MSKKDDSSTNQGKKRNKENGSGHKGIKKNK